LEGVKEIAVYNRKSAGFNDSQKKLANFTERTNCVIHLNDLADTEKLAKDVAESVLLVNATSVGMHPHAHSSPIENYAMIQPKLFVYDAIYNPRETQLLKEARLRGAETSNGLDMLLYQGAAAFEQWTGQKMPVSVVKRKIENR
ncbi:MAG: shikimate dehydrogenase, partial [Enterococcus faecalis]